MKKVFINSLYPVAKIKVIDNSLKLPNDFKYLRSIWTIKYGYQYFYCQMHMSYSHIYLPEKDFITKKKISYPDILNVEYIPYSEEDKQEMYKKMQAFTKQ